ncbi:MAG: chemotaxis protein CheA [Erythrobacter sp.]
MKDDDIQQIFFVECDEALEAAETGLDACKAGTHDAETINAIFRGVHSIKGGAGAFGYSAMQAYTHCFENLLGDIREGTVELTAPLVDLLLTALDVLRDHVEAARGQADAPDDGALMARLEAARQPAGGAAPPPAASDLDLDFDLDALLDDLGDPPAAATSSDTSPPPASWLVHLRPHAGAMDNGGEPVLWLRELARLGGVCAACDTGAVPAIDELAMDEGYLGWTFRMPGTVSREDVAEIFDFAGEDCALAYGDDAAIPPCRMAPAAPVLAAAVLAASGAANPVAAAPPAADAAPPAAPSAADTPAAQTQATQAQAARPAPAAAPPATSQSVRIDLAKLDRLIDGVGELVIAQSMLAQRLDNENFAHIEELALLETLVRDIQEHAMAFRAQPISAVFGRVPRLLRELASNTGKHVKLVVSGETTELDKTVIERLSEPMTHLIRNAVDHGIEPPAERIAAGKEPEGTLSLAAEQKAGRIIIEIRDDGRGINREKVLAKAIANGIVAPDAELSDDEINQLIFAPGFSTAAEVTSVSGRGVGMDVVRSNVKDLGGRITIETTPGQGTTFTLALPLTLAISDGMIVQTGDQALVIPLAHVIESLRPAPGEVKGMGTRRQMLNVRGRFVPIVSLGAMTGAAGSASDPCAGVLVLVETESHGQAALLVDAITDQRQFVIKSLDANFRSVDSVAGATILGNGKVALIVDVDYLVQSAVGAAPVAAAA